MRVLCVFVHKILSQPYFDVRLYIKKKHRQMKMTVKISMLMFYLSKK